MGSSRHYTLKKMLLTDGQARVLVEALKQFEEREMDHGSPEEGDVALTLRRKIKQHLATFQWVEA